MNDSNDWENEELMNLERGTYLKLTTEQALNFLI